MDERLFLRTPQIFRGTEVMEMQVEPRDRQISDRVDVQLRRLHACQAPGMTDIENRMMSNIRYGGEFGLALECLADFMSDRSNVDAAAFELLWKMAEDLGMTTYPNVVDLMERFCIGDIEG